MFAPMALTVVFALLGSLVCALTLMPVLATFFLGRVSPKEPWLSRVIERIYVPLLSVAMHRPRVTFLSAGTLFVVSLGAAPFLGAEFIPRLDEGAIAMQVWRLPSISLQQSNAISSTGPRSPTTVSSSGVGTNTRFLFWSGPRG